MPFRCSDFRRLGVFLSLLVFLVVGCRTAEPVASSPGAAEAAVRAVLTAQQAAWNRGDLEGFMAGYAQTDTLRFASGGTERQGWEAALAGYQRGYPDRAAMGTLTFEIRDVDVLAPRWTLVFGAWRLDRAEDAPHGLFTLLFRQMDDGAWRIVHDHTSAGA
ncbi:MAG: DUF4440 domain-containing protein [Bacteroidetes bacterium]|jgi:uncharacterized protein (TIGR02246 family)|nr:DUF4440 domain-containing protein [Bacteroidota bacterium]